MNKKEESAVKKSIIELPKKIDGTEDLDITYVANDDGSSNYLLYVLTFLFIIVLISSIIFIKNYNKVESNINNTSYNETIEINTNKGNITIANNYIEEKITNNNFNENGEYIIEKTNYIKYNSLDENPINYNVRYTIITNDFSINSYSTNDSEVLVRFSYSYDNENWNYINNSISLTDNVLNPLMGNFYDIAGLEETLNVITGNELNKKNNIVYWRSETIFKKKSKKEQELNKEYKADFKIEYNGNN